MNLTAFQAAFLYGWVSPALISAFRHGPRLIQEYLRDRRRRAKALAEMEKSENMGPRGSGYYPSLTWGHVVEAVFRCLCPVWNVYEAIVAVVILVMESVESILATFDTPVVKLKPKKEKK